MSQSCLILQGLNTDRGGEADWSRATGNDGGVLEEGDAEVVRDVRSQMEGGELEGNGE